jgi:hypothetical protein
MKVFEINDRRTLVPENAEDIVKILCVEEGVDSINYSDQSTFEDLIGLVPCSRQSGRGYGHVTISKEDFAWLQQAVADQVGRPISFVHISPATA